MGSNIGLKCCSNCYSLKKNKESYPIQPISYSCPIINNLLCLATTKTVRLKLNELKKFYCNNFINKNK